MPTAHLGGITLYYELHGDPTGQPLVLVAGQGAQLISWPEQLRNQLIDAGFQVLLYDNRDVGWSTKCQTTPDYHLSDMADDLAALMDVLGWSRAHIVGQSMGGMIAQQLVIDHPEKVASLCSIYSAPNASHLTSDPQSWAVRNEPPATNRDAAIDQYIRRERVSGLAELDENWVRAYAAATIDRCYDPAGAERQMAAVRRSSDRTAGLRAVTVPTAVIHGLADRLIRSSGGLATAAAIPGAELHVYADMGHQLLPSLHQDYLRVIVRTAGRATLAQPAAVR